MIVTERKTDVFNQRAGGKGETIMEHIVDEKLYGGKIITYARVILKPGCSLGLHKHVGTSETMYLLQGKRKPQHRKHRQRRPDDHGAHRQHKRRITGRTIKNNTQNACCFFVA